MMRVQRFELGERNYSIFIERGLMNYVGKSIVDSFAPTSICVVTDSNIAPLYLGVLEKALQAGT